MVWHATEHEHINSLFCSSGSLLKKYTVDGFKVVCVPSQVLIHFYCQKSLMIISFHRKTGSRSLHHSRILFYIYIIKFKASFVSRTSSSENFFILYSTHHAKHQRTQTSHCTDLEKDK